MDYTNGKRMSEVIFDPFGDYKQRGYLRNTHQRPLGKEIKKLEAYFFYKNIQIALDELMGLDELDYASLLATHRRLFEELYPWAGQDRYQLFPGSVVWKQQTVFAPSNYIERAFELGWKSSSTLGQTLGHWLYAHPFLEGNGRAIFTFFDVYLSKQHQELAWNELDKSSFLRAIDDQIQNPEGTALDQVLQPYLRQKGISHTPSGLTKIQF